MNGNFSLNLPPDVPRRPVIRTRPHRLAPGTVVMIWAVGVGVFFLLFWGLVQCL